MQQTETPKWPNAPKDFNREHLLSLLHIASCGIGLLFLGYSLFFNIVSLRIFSPYPLVFNSWAEHIYFPGKRNELLSYIGSISVLFTYFVTIIGLYWKFQGHTQRFFKLVSSSKSKTVGFVILCCGVNFLIPIWKAILSENKYYFFFAVFWIALTFAPFHEIGTEFCKHLNRFVEKNSKLAKVSIVIGLLQLISMFTPYLRGDIRMINEFLDIPETTLLKSGPVDNATFINRSNVFGIQKYSPLQETPYPIKPIALEADLSPEFEKFLRLNLDSVEYDRENKMVYVNRTLTEEARSALTAQSSSESFKTNLIKHEFNLSIKAHQLAKSNFSEEELEFIGKNKFSFVWQILNRWVIHHHNFVLAPISEYWLGKDPSTIYTQYGKLNVYVMKWLMERLGGLNYQTYFKVSYSFYIFYYALALLIFALIFKLPELTAATFLASISILNLIGFQILFLGPGLNPIRHFFDLSILLLLMFYITKRSTWILLAAMGVTTLAIANNFHTGLSALLALLAALAFLAILDRRFFNIRVLISSLIGVAGLIGTMALFGGGYDPVFQYYVSGISGYPLSNIWIILALGLSCIYYFILFCFKYQNTVLRVLAAFVTFYSQGIFVYCVWGGTWFHILNFAPIFILNLILVAALVASEFKFSKFLSNITLAAMILLFGITTIKFYLDQNQYYKIFRDHTTYEWNFESAKFTSTMNPEIFKPDIELIRQHSGDSNGIFILSKYDYFLPFLATKYSAMPYFDLAWFMLTEKEINTSISSIQEAKPQFLFVDKDIKRPIGLEVIPVESVRFGGLNEESRMRLGRLKGIRRVFEAIEKDYDLVKDGNLISVLKRKGEN